MTSPFRVQQGREPHHPGVAVAPTSFGTGYTILIAVIAVLAIVKYGYLIAAFVRDSRRSDWR